jgi:hypothetical protein
MYIYLFFLYNLVSEGIFEGVEEHTPQKSDKSKKEAVLQNRDTGKKPIKTYNY